jgi:hypothetical protein
MVAELATTQTRREREEIRREPAKQILGSILVKSR